MEWFALAALLGLRAHPARDPLGGRHAQDGGTPHPTGGYVAIKVDPGGVFYHGAGGLLHRLDGPAIELPDRTREWWLNGYKVTEEQCAEIVARLRETGEAP